MKKCDVALAVMSCIPLVCFGINEGDVQKFEHFNRNKAAVDVLYPLSDIAYKARNPYTHKNSDLATQVALFVGLVSLLKSNQAKSESSESVVPVINIARDIAVYTCYLPKEDFKDIDGNRWLSIGYEMCSMGLGSDEKKQEACLKSINKNSSKIEATCRSLALKIESELQKQGLEKVDFSGTPTFSKTSSPIAVPYCAAEYVFEMLYHSVEE